MSWRASEQRCNTAALECARGQVRAWGARGAHILVEKVTSGLESRRQGRPSWRFCSSSTFSPAVAIEVMPA